MIKKNFEMAKIHIEKASIFKYLTTKERNVIAYNAYTLRFEKNSILFSKGDDVNAFFIVIKGKVEILIPEKKEIIMSTGDSFGENSF